MQGASTTSLSLADDDDDDDARDDVRTGARSRSPSSDVERILDAVRDTTAVYSGDFTLRRVFSLEEELAPSSGSETSQMREDSTADLEQHPASAHGTWTLPLSRRSTALRMFGRLNGVTRDKSAVDDQPDDAGDEPNSILHTTAACPVNLADYRLRSTPSPRPDSVQKNATALDRDEEPQAGGIKTACCDPGSALGCHISTPPSVTTPVSSDIDQVKRLVCNTR